MKKSIYVTIALVSFVTMLFELLQTRILSFIFWNDVVYLAVSMALLGFGISGSLVSLLSSKIKDRQRLLSRLLVLFATTMILALVGTGGLPYLWLLNRFKLISSDLTILIQLLFCYVLYLLPFICAGAIISIILSSKEWKVAKLYAVDLLAAGLACLLFFWLLPVFGPQRLIGFMSASVALMSLFLRGMKDIRQQKFTVVVAATGILIACFGIVNIVTQPYKDWFRMNFDAKLMATIEKSIWTPLCRIDVVGDETHTLPYFGSLYPPHSFKIILQEGSALTRILSKEAIDKTFRSIKIDDPIGVAWM